MKINKILNKITVMAIVLLASAAFANSASALPAAKPVTGTFTDNNSVEWIFSYTPDDEKEEINLGISFYKKPANMDEISIPGLDFVSSKINNLPTNVSTMSLESCKTNSDYTCLENDEIGNRITLIDFSNIDQINGVSPMIDSEVPVKLVFGNDAKIGGLGNPGAFEGAKVNVNDFSKIKIFGNAAFKNATFLNSDFTLNDLDLTLTSSQEIWYESFSGSNVKTLNTNTVTVGNSSFKNCKKLESVTFGNDVEYIDGSAFWGTSSLVQDIKLPNKVSKADYAIFYESAITSIDLSNATYVGSQAFYGSAISSIKYGKAETIDYQAFSNCKNITSADFSTTVVREIKTEAFYQDNIDTLELDGVKYISYHAFAENKLTEITLPKGLERLNESNLFEGQFADEYASSPASNTSYDKRKGIKKVTIKYDTMINSVGNVNFRTIIGQTEYLKVETLNVIAPYSADEQLPDKHVNYSYFGSWYGKDAVPQYGNADSYKNVIAPGYFYGMSNLKNLTVGEGYEFLGGQSFFINDSYGSTSITIRNVKLPSTLKGIGDKAFYQSLHRFKNENNEDTYVTINLPAGLVYIGDKAFMEDDGFNEDVDLEELTFLGEHAFYNSHVGSNVYLHDKLAFFGEDPFFRAPKIENFIVDVDLYSLPGSYSWSHAFVNHIGMGNDSGQKFKTIKFTDKVVTEPCQNFQDYSCRSYMYKLNAEVVDLSATKWVRTGESMFQNAEIGTVKLPNELTEIATTTFYGASVKNEITLPSTLKKIQNSAFQDSKTKVSAFPEGLEEIRYAAFYRTAFNNNPVVPTTVSIIEPSAFGTDRSGDPIHFDTFTFKCGKASGQLNGQQIMNNTVMNKLILSKEVTGDYGDPRFYGVNTQTIQIDGLKKIPQGSFQDSPVKELILTNNNNLETIEAFAFYNDENLANVKTPNNSKDRVISLGHQAFANTGMKTIGGSDSDFDLTSAKYDASSTKVFYEMKKLESVVVPANFSNGKVPEYTFASDKKLKTVTIADGVASIEAYAFSEDDELNRVILWGDTFVEPVFSGDLKVEYTPNISSGISSKMGISKLGNFTFTIKEKDSGDVVATINQDSFGGNSGMAFPGEAGKTYILESSGDVTFDTSYTNVVLLEKNNPSTGTIPATADIYAYSMYQPEEYIQVADDHRHNDKLNVNSQFYPLDEVLYITSNNPKVILNDEGDDFDKSELIVYALRRDGVILESDEWLSYTKAFKRSTQNIEFESMADVEVNNATMILDSPVAMNKINLSTENFAKMAFAIVDDEQTGKKRVDLFYTDKYTESVTDTDIKPKKEVAEIIGDIINIVVPNTGDKIAIYVAVFAISAIGVVVFTKKKSKTTK